MKKYLLPFALITFIGMFSSYLVEDLSFWPRLLMVGVIMYGSIVVIFDMFKSNTPAALNGQEVKAFFQSRIFWLAFATFIASIARGLFGVDLTAEDINTLISLDWSNIITALASAGILVLRRFNPTTLLK